MRLARTHAAAAAYAQHAVVVCKEAVELVVHAMTYALARGRTEVVTAGNNRELGRCAGIPHATALAGHAIGVKLVANVEAEARGAYRRARRARKAAASQLLPKRIAVENVHEHGNFLHVGNAA